MNEDTVAAAASWCQTLECRGGTNTLQALRVALADDSINGIYVLSDGLPDDSTKHILREVQQMKQGRTVHVRPSRAPVLFANVPEIFTLTFSGEPRLCRDLLDNVLMYVD